jgi:hypothetical protein
MCQKVQDSLGSDQKLFSCGEGKVPKLDKMMTGRKSAQLQML